MRHLILSTLALVLTAGQTFGAAFNAPIVGGSGGNSVTGSVVVTSPLVLANGTNVQLPLILANLATNTPFTNVSQIFSNIVTVNPTANVLTNGILLTNAVKYAGTLASASRPVLVRIMPGTYGTPTNTLPSVMWAVDNVSTYWEPGAVWWSGTADGDVGWMFDDQTAARTNCSVLGYGRFFATNAGVSVFYTDKESRIKFECLSMYVTDGVAGNTTAAPFSWGGVTNEMDVTVHDYMESADYDAFYGDLAAGQRLRLKAKTVRAIGDIFEFSTDSPQWGNVILDIDRAEQTATIGQPSFLQMAGRVHARIGQIKVAATNASMAANGSTNGILQGAIIELPPNGLRSVIQDNSGGTWHTGIWLRDCVLIGPTNVDALTLTNQSTVPTILENTTIRTGWASTNWARGATPSTVKIVGGFNLDPYKPLGSQVTVISTNYLPAIRNIGTLVQHGQSWFSNAVNVIGADVTVGGGVYSDVGVFSNITAAIQFNLPNGAGPYLPADGDIFFDNDYWGAGRGAFVSWDGTANVVIPLALQSDTPNNGQVLKFNTGGTFTWEDDNNSGGGSGGTNFPNVNLVVGNTNLTLSAGVRKSFVVYTNGSSGVDLDLAVPSSGYEVDITVTNYGGSAITMTFFTNGVGAVFYDLQEKTNNTSWSVSPGGATYSKFIYIPTFGNWVRAVHSAPSLVFAVDTADFYMSTGGVNNLTATLGVTNYTGSGLLVRRIAPTFSNVVTFASTPSTDYGTVKLMSGDNQEYTAFGHHGVGGHSNLFRFSVINPQPNQILRMDSVIISGTENQMVMTNSTVSIDGNGVVSNVTQIKFKATASPAITTSNLLINFNTNRYFLTGLTNAIFTNLVEESTSTLDSADTTIFVKNTTGVTMGLVWPAYGAQHGYFIRTNANNPVISTTSLAAGAVGVASITVMPDGTNMFLTFTTWP